MAAVLALGLAATGCAPTLVIPTVSEAEARAEAEKQRELAFSFAMKREERLFNVGLPLLVAAKEFCDGRVGNIYGFLLTDKMEFRKKYGKDFEEVAARYFGIGEGVFIRYVHPALPAARAGLRRGDRVVAVDGRHVEDLSASEIMAIVGRRDRRTLRLEVVREWRRLKVEIHGVSACMYALKMVNHDSVNAFADGRNVGITTGMMRFVDYDEELSIVVAHEISHNALGHVEKRQGNILLGTLVDILIAGTTGVDTGGTFGKIGLLAYSQSFEAEADYAGLYIAARAGYDITGASNIWRRMAVEHPGSIKENYLGTHPSSPRRFLLIEQTVKEIGDKRMRGAPLVPEKKKVKQER
jgi:hypothetical protein